MFLGFGLGDGALYLAHVLLLLRIVFVQKYSSAFHARMAVRYT